MKEKKKEMQKQVLTLLGILIFAFVNVFSLIIRWALVFLPSQLSP